MSGKRTRWTLRALWRGAYIEKDNPDAAARVVARIVTAVDALAEYPASGPGRIKSTRELVLADIPYRISRDVEILTVCTLTSNGRRFASHDQQNASAR